MNTRLQFKYRDRLYICQAFDTASYKGLVIENSDGDFLEIQHNSTKGYKRDRNGNYQALDLSHPYLQGLIHAAEDIIKKYAQEQQGIGQQKSRTHNSQAPSEESKFFQETEVLLEESLQDLDQQLKIVVVGKVSSGKSSLINALLDRARENPVVKVGAESGITTQLKYIKLDDRTILVDSPGLDDIRQDNSKITQDFLDSVDVGILVVTGSADESQNKHLRDLKQTCKSVFVVLNKIDQWDDLNEAANQKITLQWQEALGEKVYRCCAKGYDPDLRSDVPLDIRGVDLLREDIEIFLDEQGKKMLLARHMKNRRKYAIGIIASAVTAVSIEALLPGKAAFIMVTQAGAIASLHYLHTGKMLSKSAVLSIIPLFVGKSVATTLFLFVTSFVPPTGILEVSAAITAASITLAMLASVNFALSIAGDLEDKELIKGKFASYKTEARAAMKQLFNQLRVTDLKDIKSIDFQKIIEKII